jgi:hypothetical protein
MRTAEKWQFQNYGIGGHFNLVIYSNKIQAYSIISLTLFSITITPKLKGLELEIE